jgi:hypothetical protein
MNTLLQRIVERREDVVDKAKKQQIGRCTHSLSFRAHLDEQPELDWVLEDLEAKMKNFQFALKLPPQGIPEVEAPPKKSSDREKQFKKVWTHLHHDVKYCQVVKEVNEPTQK